MSGQIQAPEHSRSRRPGFLRVDPDRSVVIESLLQDLGKLEWGEGSRRASLQALFDASNTWALEQVRYYQRRRARRMIASGMLRGTAIVFGTAGVIVPLLTPFFGEKLAHLGYVLLAIAGGALAANSVFGGTTGHMRSVHAQLALERLILENQAKWCMLSADWPCDTVSDEHLEAGFALIEAYATAVHETVIAETREWREITLAELERFEARFEQDREKLRDRLSNRGIAFGSDGLSRGPCGCRRDGFWMADSSSGARCRHGHLPHRLR